jgi:hypothetical protein
MAPMAPRALLFLPLAAALAAAEPRDVRTDHFATAVACAPCHGNADDSGALRDARGRGIAPHDLWRGTMMANASRDPLFRAVLAAEAKDAATEARCLHCHAPMASIEERAKGRPGLRRAQLDPAADDESQDLAALARDGVSCTVCHQILPEGLGTPASFDGGFRLGDEREIFGPHADPWAMPMKRFTEYWATHGTHILDSALCATCHTATAGGLFEHASYLEWRNSEFRDEGGVRGPKAATCQACHAPVASARTRIARSPHTGDLDRLAPREPVGRHVFVGGNTLVPALLRDHARDLGVEAPAAAFDATIALAREQLRERTARVQVEEAVLGSESLHISVRVDNLAGHKLPTGHSSRRAWLRLRVRDTEGRILFASGECDAEGRILGPDGKPLPSEGGGPVAPHRAKVSSAAEVQIYEAVLARGDGAVALSGATATGWAKDNRLLPLGWTAEHPDAAATAPVGTDGDADFRAGGDVVVCEIPWKGDQARYAVEVALLYQPLSARYAAELSVTDLPEVQLLRRLLEKADRAPEILAEARLEVRE